MEAFMLKHKSFLKAAFLSTVVLTTLGSFSAHAQQSIQMLPPTPLGSTTQCPGGTQQMLSYTLIQYVAVRPHWLSGISSRDFLSVELRGV
jgi:hypothetical protein